MKKKLLKKIIITASSVFTILVVVLCVHIYKVTHKKITDPNAIALAKIDFIDCFDDNEANKFSAWFAQQKGIHKASFIPHNNNGIVAYYPTQTNATEVIENFKKHFNVNANRYMPSKEEMMKGCPVKM